MKIFIIILITSFLIGQTNERVAVFTINSSVFNEIEKIIITDKIVSILESKNLVTVIDRFSIEKILNEHALQLSGIIDESTAIELGKILGVNKVINGSIGKFGDLYILQLSLINVETAKVEKTSSYNHKGSLEDLVTEVLKYAVDDLMINIKPDWLISPGFDLESFRGSSVPLLRIEQDNVEITTEIVYPEEGKNFLTAPIPYELAKVKKKPFKLVFYIGNTLHPNIYVNACFDDYLFRQGISYPSWDDMGAYSMAEYGDIRKNNTITVLETDDLRFHSWSFDHKNRLHERYNYNGIYILKRHIDLVHILSSREEVYIEDLDKSLFITARGYKSLVHLKVEFY